MNNFEEFLYVKYRNLPEPSAGAASTCSPVALFFQQRVMVKIYQSQIDSIDRLQPVKEIGRTDGKWSFVTPIEGLNRRPVSLIEDFSALKFVYRRAVVPNEFPSFTSQLKP
jgi:hypothetical protein